MYDLKPLIEPLVELVIELLLKQAARRLSRAAASGRRRIPRPATSRFAVRQAKFVDHEPALRAIRAALEDAPTSRILFLSGPGGAGKTRLLQEASRLAKQRATASGLRWGGVIDLYHPDFHSVPALQAAIAQGLDPESRYFTQYAAQRKRFERRRAQGLLGLELDAEMDALGQAFLSDYQSYASDYRVVLAFDTLENLSYETDFVQTVFRLGALTAAAREWLLREAGKLPNTVLLLAGRPEPTLLREAQQAYGAQPGHLEVIDVAGLSRSDSRSLMQSLVRNDRRLIPLLAEEVDRLWQVTQGLPVQLALVAELLSQTELLDRAELLRTNDPATWQRQLVQRLFSYADLPARLFFFLGIARQGLNTDLLHYLAPEWPREECERRLVEAQRLCIVKTRPSKAEVFLHDALYELFDGYMPEDPSLPRWHGRIAEYYQAQQDRHSSVQQVWCDATVKRLYYELRCEPRVAFQRYYTRWSESAIKGHDVTFDLQLRNVLLRFMAFASGRSRNVPPGLSKTEVELDGAVRWVKRLLARHRNQQAAGLAEAILALGPSPYKSYVKDTSPCIGALSDHERQDVSDLFGQADAGFWGILLTYYGEALAYLGPVNVSASSVLDKAIELLEAQGGRADDLDVWLQRRALGRAHNTQGYVARLAGHYGAAMHAFRRALPYFEELGIADEQADTLNNLAYLLGVLGEQEAALHAANQALDLRLNQGQPYPLALSYNTRGLILSLGEDTTWGAKDCSLALSMFEELEEKRGIGLACNALGFIFRRQACQFPLREAAGADDAFSTAQAFFDRAVQIFSSEVAEPVRLWEAKNELGSLHRDWATLAQRRHDHEQARRCFRLAEAYQREAIDIAREHQLRFQEADSRDDLAKLLADQERFVEAESELSYIEQNLVGRKYRLLRGQGFDRSLQPGETAWLVQGKVHLKRGLWSLQKLESNQGDADGRTYLLADAIEHLALCAAYFQQFWPHSTALEQAVRAMSEKLAASGIPGRLVVSRFQEVSETYRIELQTIGERVASKLDF